jgi:hypothetical protein
VGFRESREDFLSTTLATPSTASPAHSRKARVNAAVAATLALAPPAPSCFDRGQANNNRAPSG